MEENNAQKKEFPLAGWIAILAALVAGVVLIFAMLEMVMPKQWDAQIWDEMTVEKGQSGTYQMRMLTDEERSEKHIRAWLESAQEWADGGNATAEHSAFWLYLQEEDVYVLYLPQQDRTLGLTDLTVSEESEESGGENTLIIRARTGENSEQVVPEEQLFAIKTSSETWRGIRVSVILDGREKNVYKLVYVDGQHFSAEEVYIGRY